MKHARSASIGIVATYPPRLCGIASYTASLVASLTTDRHRVGVVSLTDRNVGVSGSPVVFHHRVGDPASLRAAVDTLNTYDTVSVQHEFGIFGGPDGDEVIDLMTGLTVPAAVTLHTVLAAPTGHQRAVVERICDLADRIVVMSQTAAARLVDGYAVDPSRVRIIAHGADRDFAGPGRGSGRRPLILTWGLIGPGKGLEWAIKACAGLRDLDPLPRYLILGSTHPQVRQESGETYRNDLMTLSRRLGVEGIVEFDDRYLSRKALTRTVRTADAVVLPYESVEQVTSGVLVEAMAAAKPVVATEFPHAVEALSDGAGILVPHRDPSAITRALRQLLTQPEVMATMTARARALAAGRYWPAVGRQFGDLMTEMKQPVPEHNPVMPVT